jgi:PAS domain S-box-containing protein
MKDRNKTKEQLIKELTELRQQISALEAQEAQRKRAEEALRESEERFRAIFEQAAVGVAQIITSTGQFLRINQRYCDIVGYTREEMIARTFHEITHPDDLPLDLDNMQRLIEGKLRNFSMEKRYFRKDGSIVWVDLTVSPLWKIGEQPNHHIAVVEDITERKKALEALRESEERLRSIVESARDAIVTTDTNGKIASWNRGAENIFGYSPEEIIGKPSILLTPERFREADRRAIGRVASTGNVSDTAATVHRSGLKKDGTEFPVEVSRAPWVTREGTFATAIMRDITDRKRTEKQIKETGEFLRSVIEGSADGILITDEKGHILSANAAAERMYGVSKEEMIGKHTSTFSSSEESFRKQTRKRIEGLFEKGFLSPFESVHKTKDGDIINVESTSSMLKDAEGNYVGGVSIVRDITDRKRMERQLVQSEKLRSLGAMATGVAHDFNNVLAVILGRAQLLRTKLERYAGEERRKSFPELMRGLEVIERTVSDGAKTVRNVQDFSRTRMDEEDFVPIDLEEIVAAAVDDARARWKDHAEARGITVETQQELFPALPTIGNSTELKEVLTNIINNAHDAMPDGGTIVIETLGGDGKVYATVEDTGIGMPPEAVERVFEPFFTTKGPGSSGLGLSVSYGIMSRHGGTISVESKQGKGTKFTVMLPVKEAQETGYEAAPEIETYEESVKALVIEDEEDVRTLLCDILTSDGHEVTAACNGEEGVELLGKADFDLVFTDLGMPAMSGWEVASSVKSRNPHTTVVLVTGWGIQLDHQELTRNGVDLVVNKPFSVEQILRVARERLADRK